MRPTDGCIYIVCLNYDSCRSFAAHAQQLTSQIMSRTETSDNIIAFVGYFKLTKKSNLIGKL